MPNGNGQCEYYSGDSSCSPWNYFVQTNTSNSGPDTELAGQQTGSVIRGQYVGAGQSETIYGWEISMSGWYSKGHATWCGALPGGTCSFSGIDDGATYVWFCSYT